MDDNGDWVPPRLNRRRRRAALSAAAKFRCASAARHWLSGVDEIQGRSPPIAPLGRLNYCLLYARYGRISVREWTTCPWRVDLWFQVIGTSSRPGIASSVMVG